ncbi:MAG TPA: alcohol dehydrogenase catalytic domain-containing protein [Geminicoccaceae bacterium]
MSRANVERIITRFGSQQRVADLLGIWQTAVSGWVRRGAIPARRQEQLLAVAQREGVELRPEDFFGHGAALPARETPVQPTAEVIPLNVGNAGRPAVDGGKDLYEVGEIPPLGHVPKNMYAWVIRREREGEPGTAMRQEIVPTPALESDEVLVLVMAAGVNYNGCWAALGKPVSVFDVHKAPYHIAGSDASGIVWAVGSKVRRWKVGDEVVVHCNQDDGDDEECNGGDPMFSSSQRIWGYETPDGSFAQFCRVQSRQLMERPITSLAPTPRESSGRWATRSSAGGSATRS